MSKSFAITLILCGICLIGSGIMDAIDMRKKNSSLEATNAKIQIENQNLKSANMSLQVENKSLKNDMKVMEYSIDKIIEKETQK